MMYVTKLSLGRFDFDHRYTCPFWKDSSSVVPIVQLKLDGLATSLMHQWSVQGDEIGRGRFWEGLVTSSRFLILWLVKIGYVIPALMRVDG